MIFLDFSNVISLLNNIFWYSIWEMTNVSTIVRRKSLHCHCYCTKNQHIFYFYYLLSQLYTQTFFFHTLESSRTRFGALRSSPLKCSDGFSFTPNCYIVFRSTSFHFFRCCLCRFFHRCWLCCLFCILHNFSLA